MVSTSVTKFISKFSEYGYLTTSWIAEEVGESFSYDESVHEYDLYAYHGVVMELFIRKHLCQKFNIPCRDQRTEKVLDKSVFKDNNLKIKLQKCYDRYQNPDSKAIDIIESIKIVALSQRLAHNEDMENIEDAIDMEVDEENLSEIVNFLKTLSYDKMVFNEFLKIRVGNHTLTGSPHFVFDDHVICQTATSMKDGAHERKYPQMVFYALGHYGENYLSRKLNKKYIINVYNPLQGLDYKTSFDITPTSYMELLTKIEKDLNAWNK